IVAAPAFFCLSAVWSRVSLCVEAACGCGSALQPSKSGVTASTGTRKRYPRRERVWMNRGLDAESPNASRSLLTMVFRLWSKSTNVSAGHRRCCNSSRVTTSPERSSSISNAWKGWSGTRIFTPCLRSSPLAESASNVPKRKIVLGGIATYVSAYQNRGLTAGLCVLFVLISFLPVSAEPKPATLAEYRHYVQLTETRMTKETSAGPFLWVGGLGASAGQDVWARLRRGDVLIYKMETEDEGTRVTAPGALIHHWLGIAFIPEATLKQTLALLQDYDRQSQNYAPRVERSRLLQSNGNDF